MSEESLRKELEEKKKQIISELGVEEATFYTWITRYGDILEKLGAVKFERGEKSRRIKDVDVTAFIKFIRQRRPQLIIRDIVAQAQNTLEHIAHNRNMLVKKSNASNYDYVLTDAVNEISYKIDFTVTTLPLGDRMICDRLLSQYIRECKRGSKRKRSDAYNPMISNVVVVGSGSGRSTSQKNLFLSFIFIRTLSPLRIRFSSVTNMVAKIKALLPIFENCPFVIGLWVIKDDRLTDELLSKAIEELFNAYEQGKILCPCIITNSALLDTLFTHEAEVSALSAESLFFDTSQVYILSKHAISI